MCGDLDNDCCYESGAALCNVGRCDPGTPAPPPDDYKKFPCMCSSTICVANAEYCAPDAICDQTVVLPPCGGAGEPCCNGLECDEEATDANGNDVTLLCNTTSYDEESGSSTLCYALEDASVADQSFGTGGAAEMCTGRDGCDSGDLSCQSALARFNLPHSHTVRTVVGC